MVSKYFEMSTFITQRSPCSDARPAGRYGPTVPVGSLTSGAGSPFRSSAPEQENHPLRHLIFQRRNAQQPFRPIRLGDVVPSHRRGNIAAGLDARQEALKIGVQICLVARPAPLPTSGIGSAFEMSNVNIGAQLQRVINRPDVRTLPAQYGLN